MSDKWDELCEAYSCIIDGYYQSELSRLREEYGLILFDYASDFHEGSSVDVETLAQYLETNPASVTLAERIYRPDSHLALDGTPAKVWNTSITLKAINQRGKGETSVTFKNIAGDTVSVYGGTEIYMEEPDLRDDEYSGKAEKFAKTVLSCFGK